MGQSPIAGSHQVAVLYVEETDLRQYRVTENAQTLKKPLFPKLKLRKDLN